MEPWFEQNVQRFEQEKKELESLNITYEIDTAALEKKLLRISLKIEGNNPEFDFPDKSKDLELVAVFPDLYPFFRPNVFGINVDLPRHQNPIDKVLCLLGRPTDLWDPSHTLAVFLKERLPLVLQKGSITNAQILAQDETEQAEPASEYFDAPAKIIFDPSCFNDATPTQIECLGKIVVGHPDVTQGGRMAVLQIFNTKNELQSELPPEFKDLYPQQSRGILYRVPSLPLLSSNQLFEWLKGKLEVQNNKIPFSGKDIILSPKQRIKNVIGLNFPEETQPGKTEMSGWIFIITGTLFKPVKPGAPLVSHNFFYYAQASRISKGDFSLRIPKLRPLQNKSIAVFGLGALGAPSAIEFAKAGIGELRLIDFDKVEAATTVRWPLGMAYAGLPKTFSLKHFLSLNYPFCKVFIQDLRIGTPRANSETPHGEFLPFTLPQYEEIFENLSLIYDAAVEDGVTNYLYFEAKKRNIPFVSIWGTQGAMGGQVLRVIPGKTKGCWLCSMHLRVNKKIKQPPADIKGAIQARGCGDLSFTGSSFDMLNIALAGVRQAVSILCEGEENAYPSLNWDLSILSLYNEKGEPINPAWEEQELNIHPDCAYCNR